MYPDIRNLATRITLRKINGNQVGEIRFRNLVTPEPSLNEAIDPFHNYVTQCLKERRKLEIEATDVVSSHLLSNGAVRQG